MEQITDLLVFGKDTKDQLEGRGMLALGLHIKESVAKHTSGAVGLAIDSVSLTEHRWESQLPGIDFMGGSLRETGTALDAAPLWDWQGIMVNVRQLGEDEATLEMSEGLLLTPGKCFVLDEAVSVKACGYASWLLNQWILIPLAGCESSANLVLSKAEVSVVYRPAKAYLDVVSVRVEESRSEKETLDTWEAYLEAHWDELQEKYVGEHVAILDGKVVDNDKDFDRLARRVLARTGYRPIFMPFIGEKNAVAEFLT